MWPNQNIFNSFINPQLMPLNDQPYLTQLFNFDNSSSVQLSRNQKTQIKINQLIQMIQNLTLNSDAALENVNKLALLNDNKLFNDYRLFRDQTNLNLYDDKTLLLSNDFNFPSAGEAQDEPINFSMKYNEENSNGVQINKNVYNGSISMTNANDFQLNFSGYTTFNEISNKLNDEANQNNTEPNLSRLKKITCLEQLDVPTNYSIQFTEYSEEGIYCQEEPIDYSRRYSEIPASSNNKKPNIINEADNIYNDTVKTFCTEDTPLNYLSVAVSMNDLHEVKEDVNQVKLLKNINNKENITNFNFASSQSHLSNTVNYQHCHDTQTLSPVEKPKQFCTEGTPANFSRTSSLSSLDVEIEKHSIKSHDINDIKESLLPSIKEDETMKEVGTSSKVKIFDNKLDTTIHTAKSVTFDECLQTPMMFSRCSSLASLSSFDVKSIHSSLISEYSRRASEVVSPSDLPDSPGESIPQSPHIIENKDNYKLEQEDKCYIDNSFIEESSKNMKVKGILKTSESSSLIHYADEGTPPDNMSARTNLSKISSNNFSNQNFRILPLGEENCRKEELDALKLSEEDENMVAECINMAMPTKSNKQIINKNFKEVPLYNSYNYALTNVANCSEKLVQNVNSFDLNTNLINTDFQNDDSLSDNDDEYDDMLLSEVIEAAMPKSKKQISKNLKPNSTNPRSIIQPFINHNSYNSFGMAGQVGLAKDKYNLKLEPVSFKSKKNIEQDITKNYAEEGTPLEFSRSTSLSNLTFDSDVNSRPNEMINSFYKENLENLPIEDNNEEVVTTYKLEDTPILFSCNDSISSLGDHFDKDFDITNEMNINNMVDNKPIRDMRYVFKEADNALFTSPVDNTVQTSKTISNLRGPNLASTPIRKIIISKEQIKLLNSNKLECADQSPCEPSNDQPLTYKVENTPTQLSGDSSLSSLSFGSNGAETTNYENALLQECINAAMPKSKRKKIVKIKPSAACPSPNDTIINNLKFINQDSYAGKKYIAKLKFDTTKSNVAESTRQCLNSTIQEIAHEKTNAIDLDATEEDYYPSGPSTEANNTVIYKGAVIGSNLDTLSKENDTGAESSLVVPAITVSDKTDVLDSDNLGSEDCEIEINLFVDDAQASSGANLVTNTNNTEDVTQDHAERNGPQIVCDHEERVNVENDEIIGNDFTPSEVTALDQHLLQHSEETVCEENDTKNVLDDTCGDQLSLSYLLNEFNRRQGELRRTEDAISPSSASPHESDASSSTHSSVHFDLSSFPNKKVSKNQLKTALLSLVRKVKKVKGKEAAVETAPSKRFSVVGHRSPRSFRKSFSRKVSKSDHDLNSIISTNSKTHSAERFNN